MRISCCDDKKKDEVTVESTFVTVMPAPSTHTFHVIYAEDNPVLRQITEMTLKSFGYLVESYPDGNSAYVACFNSLKEGRTFDLILTDKHMGGGEKDGGKFLSKMRELEGQYGRSHIPIVAFSDNIQEEDRVLFDHCIAKQSTPSELREEFQRLPSLAGITPSSLSPNISNAAMI